VEVGGYSTGDGTIEEDEDGWEERGERRDFGLSGTELGLLEQEGDSAPLSPSSPASTLCCSAYSS